MKLDAKRLATWALTGNDTGGVPVVFKELHARIETAITMGATEATDPLYIRIRQLEAQRAALKEAEDA